MSVKIVSRYLQVASRTQCQLRGILQRLLIFSKCPRQMINKICALSTQTSTRNVANYAFGAIPPSAPQIMIPHCQHFHQSTTIYSHKSLSAVDAESLTASAQNIRQVLFDNGCQEVEVLESPEVLKLSAAEVKLRLRRLNDLNVVLDVTPVMLSLAGERKKSKLKTLIKKYQDKHNGQCSRVRQLRSRLNLSDDDIKILADSGAKLLHSTTKLKSVECLEWLLWKGYSLQEIASVPAILDKSIEVVSSRHKDLMEFNLPRPSLQYVSLTHRQYYSLMQKLNVNPNPAETIRMSGDFLHARSTAVTNIKQMEPIWKYLSDHGFSNSEIKKNATELLKMDFEVLQNIVKSSQKLTTLSVSLHALILLCNNNVKARKSALKGILSCSLKDLPSAERGSPFGLLYAQEPAIYFENLQFLLDAGFSLSDISKCPVIVGHRPQIVQHYWDYIKDWDSPDLLEMKQDLVKYLEMLQYEIEKESNFLQGILI